MKFTKLKKALGALGGVALISIAGTLFTAPAHAVLLTQSQVQTVTGQLFNFAFGGAPVSDGTGGILTIRARGDFSLNPGPFPGNECLDWDIDGVASAINACPSLGNTVTLFAFDDREWEESFAISVANMLAIASDNAVAIAVDFNNGVDVGLSAAPFVRVTLNYNRTAVPEPATLALFGLGLAGLGFARRRRTPAA